MPNVLGIIGSGDITETNAAALLDNFLPEGDIFGIYTTERVTRGQKGLKVALSWMESEDLEIDRVADVVQVLVDHLTRKHEPVLIVVGTEGVEAEIKDAQEAGIQVVDLTKALDDVLPAEPEDVEVSKADDSTDLSGAFTGHEIRVLKRLAAFMSDFGKAYGPPTTGPDNSPPFDPPYTKTEKPKAPAAPAPSTERREGTKPYFVTEDGSIRPARGRKRDTETKVFLDDDEAAAYVEANS